ncbi:MAG TPA: beta/gamma crystallin-related protein [Sphingomicrobium sp.]|nr:beta/gamma crystallin-related protein [Sphingomicrobium sp.]
MRAVIRPILLTTLVLLPTSLQGQPGPVTRPAPPLRPQPVGPSGEIVIYRDRNFDGPAVAVSHDEPNLRLVWTVNSARVHGGTWQLCERANYHGTCMTLSNDNRNLGHRRVQSVRLTKASGTWRVLGRADINRIGWVHRTIGVAGHPSLQQVRLCAERAQLRLHNARIRFTNNLIQVLHVPSQLASGNCTAPAPVTGGRRFVSTVDVTAATVGVSVLQGRLRVEGR